MNADGLLPGQKNNPSAHAEQIRARVPIGFAYPSSLPADRERAALWFSAAAIGLPVAILFLVIGIIKFCG